MRTVLFSPNQQQTRGVARQETVWERIDRLIDDAVRADRIKNAAQFLNDAGLSSGWLAERRGKIAQGKDPSLSADTAVSIAAFFGVTLDYLLTGKEPHDPPLIDKYANRAWAVNSARQLQFPEAAIQSILKEDPGGEPSRLYWFRRIEAESERVRPAADGTS